ncbi:hypothetical protein [Lachnotalea glycerini]|uniref:Flagellar hook-associated protein 2 C-terminal domain-containing protein n=1 Tax=Lachnotalea glycerini TaxID=1763509 RepID=A0A371JGL7_9FIRM|nr:hypothetical protein [Lachnotalea glycerini]RDY31873.1 hypothetical protein CG710_007775 [Lachnotalea glycerini]
MRIESKLSIRLARTKASRQAMKERKSSRSAASKKNTTSNKSTTTNSILSALNSKKTTASKYQTSTTTQLKTNYTAVKTVAGKVQEDAAKLLATGSDSLFGKALSVKAAQENSTAAENTLGETNELTAAESAKAKESVLKVINSFIDDYNTMLNKLDNIGGSLNNMYAKQLRNYVTQNETALKNIGITKTKAGTLSVNQEKLKTADISAIQKVFGTNGSFVYKVASKSKSVEANAETNLASLNKSTYSSFNYNKSGISYNSDKTSSYHAKG